MRGGGHNDKIRRCDGEEDGVIVTGYGGVGGHNSSVIYIENRISKHTNSLCINATLLCAILPLDILTSCLITGRS